MATYTVQVVIKIYNPIFFNYYTKVKNMLTPIHSLTHIVLIDYDERGWADKKEEKIRKD